MNKTSKESTNNGIQTNIEKTPHAQCQKEYEQQQKNLPSVSHGSLFNILQSEKNLRKCKKYQAKSSGKTVEEDNHIFTKKIKLNAENNDTLEKSSENRIDICVKKQKKTNAKRQKEYRQRKKEKLLSLNASNHNYQQNVKKKSHAQRQKEYEQRQKNLPSVSHGSRFDNLQSEKNSRKCKKYRAKSSGLTFEEDNYISTKKIKLNAENNDTLEKSSENRIDICVKKQKKTNAERQKKYRQRKKEKLLSLNASNHDYQQNVEKKSHAQRQKEYEQRQKKLPSVSYGSLFDNLQSEKNLCKCKKYRAKSSGITFKEDNNISI